MEESTPELVSNLTTEIKALRKEIASLTSLLYDSEILNPVPKPKCSEVLIHPTDCSDFKQKRQYVGCRAWELMEDKGLGRKEAFSQAWEETKGRCGDE